MGGLLLGVWLGTNGMVVMVFIGLMSFIFLGLSYLFPIFSLLFTNFYFYIILIIKLFLSQHTSFLFTFTPSHSHPTGGWSG